VEGVVVMTSETSVGKAPEPSRIRPARQLVRALQSMPDPLVDDQRDALVEVQRLLEDLARAEAGPDDKLKLRTWIAQDVRACLEENGVTGRIAEIGGSRNGLSTHLPEWDFTFLSLYPGDDPQMLVADISACPQVPDESFDAVVSVNCFEHIERPWRAAEEITRILRPGGVTYHFAPFSYFYHLAPVDLWRYTPDAFTLMFRDLEPLKAEFYGANRRRNNLGSEGNPVDGDGGPAFAPDGFGGWRENWYTVYAGRKTPGWAERRHERERLQVVVDVCKALQLQGVEEASLPIEAYRSLSVLGLSRNGEVVRAEDGTGLGLSVDAVAEIWRDRGRLGIKPSFRRFARLAMTGFPAAASRRRSEASVLDNQG